MYYTIESGDYNWNTWLTKWFPPLLLLGILVNASGLFITILEPDGALYATIAKTIVQSGDYINLKVEGKDWLDKPHFPFWLTAFSYKLFGINTIAYKLPAFLFWLTGGLYTYLYAKSAYNKNIAKISVLIYLTAAHLVISNNDVRAEPYLTGLIIASVYHFYRASDKGVGYHLVLGSLFAAFGIMTKGPFVGIIISSGFIATWVINKDWKQFLHYRWWLAILLVALFVLPELYCLHQQFDLHPEKIVFDRKGVSGIKFFFWDSQYGRFMNNGPIRGNGDPLFFVHTLLWAFLPWSLLFYVAVIVGVRNIRANTFKTEVVTVGCSLITFIMFSLSRFQLPHYINIVFPFFSIITAQYLYGMFSKSSTRLWVWVQHALCFLLIALLVVLVICFGQEHQHLIITLVLISFAGFIYLFPGDNIPGMMGRSFATVVILYTFINISLYLNLLEYQSGSNAATFINIRKRDEMIGTYLENSYSFAFYIKEPFKYYYSPDSIKAATANHDLVIFTSEESLKDLSESGLTINILKTFPHFHISQLTGQFLNYKTRSKVIRNMVVARVSKARPTSK